MLKLTIVASALIMATTAFWVGRWTAPTFVQPNTSEATTTSDTQLINDSSAVAIPSVSGVPAKAKPSAAPSRSLSYAADTKTLQGLLVLAETNPQLAMERAQDFKGPIRLKAESAILDIWATKDPNGAWNWLQSFRPGNTEQFISVLETIGRSEPRSALSYAQKFADSRHEMRKDIYLAAITGITQAGAYSVATEFLEHLDIEPAIKGELISFVASSWGVYEPQAAMQWLSKQPQELRAGAASRLSESWADVDPQGATNYAASVPSPESDPALQQSFSKWLATDSAAATAWLAAEPDQKNLDPLLSEVATQPELVNSQVKTALSWAERVTDPELRLSTVTTILSAFKQRDSRAALAYLQEITFLTDAERSQLKENLAF